VWSVCVLNSKFTHRGVRFRVSYWLTQGAPVICLGTRNETSGACIDPTLDFYANTSLVNMTAINEQGSNKTLQGELAHLFIFY